jgi:hypothetical protein
MTAAIVPAAADPEMFFENIDCRQGAATAVD